MKNSDTAEKVNQEQPLSAPRAAQRLWLKILLGVIVLLILAAAGLSYLLFAPWQEVPAAMPSLNDMAVQYRFMRKISKEFSRKKGPLRESAVLELPFENVNSIFRIAGNVKPKNAPYPIRYYRPSLNDKGEFSAVVPVATQMKWLWGGTVYVKMVFSLSKAPGDELQCRVSSLKITSLPVSRGTAQKIADRLLADPKVKKQLAQLNDVVKSISFQKGKFRIEYSPARILMLMGR